MQNFSLYSIRLFVFIIFCSGIQSVFGQNGVAIASGTSATADNSAMLDVQSSSKGILIPRMTNSLRGSISLPANGLLVFCTDAPSGFYYNSGSTTVPVWVLLSAGALSGTGTTNQYAKWSTSSVLANALMFDNGTSIGIGSGSPAALIDINANGSFMTAATGAGGNVNITAQNAGSTGNGGSIILTPGTTTAGTAGGVGIGTTTVPRGGIGDAILAIQGTDGSNNGPHVQYTTSADNYPLYQQLNWTHDNVALNFDASYTSTAGYLASSTTAPFQIYKHSGVLNFNYAAASTVGSAVTFKTGLDINSSGVVQVPNLAGAGNRAVTADASGNLHVGSTLGSGNKATFSYTTSTGTGASGTPSTGATWTIQSGVTQVFVKLWGAGGGGSTSGGSVGGGGGFISGWLTWPSGTTSLTIIVGGGGGLGGSTGTAGTNGGGSSNYQGGGGGGRSCIQVAAADYVAAGGGGGAIDGNYQRYGGAGGGGQGLPGWYATANGQATGGTQTAVGSSGVGNTAASGHVGGSHSGGSSDSYGGGGGGGWFGGGAGGSSSANGNDGGGAGGSSGGNSTYFTFVWGEPGQVNFNAGNQPSTITYGGGMGDPDYIYGTGFGGMPSVCCGLPTNVAGNGYVVIYW